MTFMKYFFVFGDKYFAEIMPKNFYHENELYFRSVLWQRRSPRFIWFEIFFSVSSNSFSCFHAFYFPVLHIFLCMYVAGLFFSWILFHCFFWPLFRFCINFIVHFILCLLWIYLHLILFTFLFISFEYVFTFWFAWFSNCELHFERSFILFAFLFLSFEYVFTFWFDRFSNCELHFERSLFHFSFLTFRRFWVLCLKHCLSWGRKYVCFWEERKSWKKVKKSQM